MNSNLEEWAEELRKKVCLKWREYENKLPKGFELFYSPVRLNPDVMIIGFNPGGDLKDARECSDKPEPLPEQHGYITYGRQEPGKDSYRIAIRMYELFSKIGHEKTLQNSVKFNLIFFRSHNITEWNSIDDTIRKDLEGFCHQKVRHIIDTLQPKLILAEGLLTYRRLKDLMPIRKNGEKEDTFPTDGSRTLVRTIDLERIKLVGIRHPTGGRPPVNDKEWLMMSLKMAELFRRYDIQ